MEDKLNHSLLFDSLPVQKFSLGVGSKGCFTTCPKHGKWDDFWGAITRANQSKTVKNIPILGSTWFLLLSCYRITEAWDQQSQIVPGCPSAINRQLHPFLSSWRANFWMAPFFFIFPISLGWEWAEWGWFLQGCQFLMLILELSVISYYFFHLSWCINSRWSQIS